MKIKNETQHVICFNEHEIPIGETADIDFECGDIELGIFGHSSSKTDNTLDVLNNYKSAYLNRIGLKFSSETNIPLRTNCHLDDNNSDEYSVRDKEFSILFTLLLLNFKSVKLYGLELKNSKTNKKVKASYNLVRKIENKWTYIFSIVDIMFNIFAMILMTFDMLFNCEDWMSWETGAKVFYFIFYAILIFGLINNIPILKILFRKPQAL